MRHSITRNFQKRFEGKIEVAYREKPLEPAEQQIQNTRLLKAFTQVLSSVLKREPTQEELLGIVDISNHKRNRKNKQI